jgi:hypothetical protein
MSLYLYACKVCTTMRIDTRMSMRTINVLYLCSTVRMFYKFFPYATLEIG